MKAWERIVIGVSMVIFVALLALVYTLGALGYRVPPPTPRDLAMVYLTTTFNPSNPLFSAMAPEAVTAIVWDYRGLDTLFETAVFFLAIIASVALMRGVSLPEKPPSSAEGMSLIVKTVTKLTIGMILAVAASIAFHGHLTPGGGFQGGATAAVAPLVALVVFSVYFLERSGVTKNRMLGLRSAGLLGIGLTAFLVLIGALLSGGTAFVFQNQPKPAAPIGLPWRIDGALTGGTLFLFNVFEALAVSAGFTIVFLLLAVPEEEAIKVVRGGEDGH